MRTSADVLRSTLRYTALALGDEWEVRPWGTEGEFKFPFARVAITVPPSVPLGSAYVHDVTMGLAVHAYPVPGATPDESIMEVERVRDLLHVAFFEGFVYEDVLNPVAVPPTTVKVRSAPRRVPLYDYDGVPLDGPDAFSVARNPSDYFRVIECPIDAGVDPEDDTQWRVIAQPRISWRRIALVASGHKIVEEVRLKQEAS